MEATTRYTRTEDGANIAYAVIGKGPPLVCPSNVWGDLQAYRHNPLWTPVVDGLAHQGFRLIIYDQRGMGGSDRGTVRYDLDARLLDLDAVIAAAVGEVRLSLHAIASAVPTAVAYAAAHPERIEKLVLVSGFVRGKQWYEAVPSMKLSMNLNDLAASDWETYTLAMANAVLHYSDSAMAARAAAAYRASATPAEYTAYIDASSKIDVYDQLQEIQAPTLLVNLTGVITGTLPLMREMAAQIPGAELIEELPGPAWARAVGRFLRGSDLPQPPAPAPPASAAVVPVASSLRTVLFTDLVGHTEMMSRLGDEAGRAVLREHEVITRDVLKQHGGTEIKTMGDGFMASFGSVTRAVECAISLQRAFDYRNRGESGNRGVGARHSESPSSSDGRTDDQDEGTNGDDAPGASPLRAPAPGQTSAEPLHVRVGLNAGEPIEEDGDLFGATVILASRIAAKAEGGEILVADTVRGLCSGKGFLFSDRGDFIAKGFEDPVRIYEVNWQ
jgi:class 3 adenylate cyclase/pimeloyl-ACP methyl ester carboxylesterase